jgi:hypothetical protein
VAFFNECTQELIDVEPLLSEVVNPMKLRSKQVVRYFKLNTHAGAISTVSLPQDLVIRSGAETA